jgi:hypothetical protein
MILVIKLSAWENARLLSRILEYYGIWIYRGQSDASWELESGIERYLRLFDAKLGTLSFTEKKILSQFQRTAHHYIGSPPKMDDKVEWLSLIRHYGGPTRLLDFTYSYFIAAFFAMEVARNDSALWAINLYELEEIIKSKKNIEENLSNYDKFTSYRNISEDILADKSVEKLVLPIEPSRLNERIAIQQGLFLFPCDISYSFMENLYKTFKLDNHVKEVVFDEKHKIKQKDIEKSSIIKIILPKNIHHYALHELKLMNVTSATLFPGLDGFARSFIFELRNPGSKEYMEISNKYVDRS